MKKVFLVLITVVGFTLTSQAQEISKHAIGLRLGDSDGFGAEISYQHGIGDNNRLEFGLGWRDGNNFSAIRAIGLYQWVFNLDGNFNWYVGAGGGFASYSLDNVPPGTDDSETESVFQQTVLEWSIFRSRIHRRCKSHWLKQ